MARSHDLFVAYSNHDREVANAIVTRLRTDGIRCWWAKHDMPSTDDFNEDLVRAIEQARLMVVVVSGQTHDSDYVKNEIQQAVNLKVPILPFCLTPTLTGSMALLLSRPHRVDATRGSLDEHLATLSAMVSDRLRPRRKGRIITPPSQPAEPATPVARFENPYDFCSPANQQTFKGRQAELDELLEAIRTYTHTAVFGLQRMGKTSLLEEGLRTRLADDKELADSLLLVNINFHFEGDDQLKYRDFAARLMRGITREIANLGLGQSNDYTDSVIKSVLSPAGQYDRGDRSEFFERFRSCLKVLATAAHRRVVLVLDEFSDVAHGIQKNRLTALRKPSREMNLLPQDQYVDARFLHFFGNLLKDREFGRQYTVIVAVRPFMAEFDKIENLQMLKLMKSVSLDYLSEADAKALITEPVRGTLRYEAECLDYLWRLTAGHPYLLQYMLKDVTSRVARDGRDVVRVDDIVRMEDRMVSGGVAFEAVFEVLMSDYSVQEVLHPQEARLGKGTLALISKLEDLHPEGWVAWNRLSPILTNHMPKEKLMSVLSQLHRTKIVDERETPEGRQFRVHVPLLRERFVKQNMYGKYFA